MADKKTPTPEWLIQYVVDNSWSTTPHSFLPFGGGILHGPTKVKAVADYLWRGAVPSFSTIVKTAETVDSGVVALALFQLIGFHHPMSISDALYHARAELIAPGLVPVLPTQALDHKWRYSFGGLSQLSDDQLFLLRIDSGNKENLECVIIQHLATKTV